MSSTPEIMKARPKGFFAAAKNRAATSHHNLIRRLSIWQAGDDTTDILF